MNEMLKLENQLCFPLYACAKEVVTYTQYIAIMVIWENVYFSTREH